MVVAGGEFRFVICAEAMQQPPISRATSPGALGPRRQFRAPYKGGC